MEFAATILQLKQQREQQAAQLAEMQRTRQMQEEVQRAQLDAQERSQAADQQKFGFEVEKFKATMASHEKAIELEAADKIKLGEQQREAVQIKALQDFADKGTAFIPTTGYGEFAKLRKSFADAGEYIHEIPIPGKGILAQRLTGESAAQLQEIQLKNTETESKIAVNQARTDQIRNKINLDVQRASGLEGKVSAVDVRAIGDTLDGYRRDALSRAALLMQSGKPDDLSRATEIQRDWRTAFDEKSSERQSIDDLNIVLQSWSSALQKGLAPPARSDNLALDLTGVKNSFNAAVAGTLRPKTSGAAAPVAQLPVQQTAPAVRAVGRITTTPVHGKSDVVYVLQDGTQITTSDQAHYLEIAKKVNSGEIPKDSPEAQQAYSVVSAIMSYKRTYAQPSWITNE